MPTLSATSTEASLTMKGSLIPMTVIELIRDDPEDFEAVLQSKVSQAPAFFENTPVVFALEKLENPDQVIHFSRLMNICKGFKMCPVAIRGGSPENCEAAKKLELAIIPAAGKKAQTDKAPDQTSDPSASLIEGTQNNSSNQDSASNNDETGHSTAATAKETVKIEKIAAPVPAKVVYHPVRSGQQVYAKDTDLIVLAPVSAGAELLADGNIHVYGPLRGRALAGIKGDSSARIFCQSLEAELVSVAGQYKISEDLQDKGWREPRQVYLEGEKLTITPLTL